MEWKVQYLPQDWVAEFGNSQVMYEQLHTVLKNIKLLSLVILHFDTKFSISLKKRNLKDLLLILIINNLYRGGPEKNILLNHSNLH